jgi:hypothetical protein
MMEKAINSRHQHWTARLRKTKKLPMDLIFSDLQNHWTQECIVQLASQKVSIAQGLNLSNAVRSQSTAGRFAIQPQFDYAQSFSGGLAWVMIGKKWGVIDKTGKLLTSSVREVPLRSVAE